MKPLRPLYIFDLDGTLANIQHRVHILEEKTSDKWNRFYNLCNEDAPNAPVIETLRRLKWTGAEIWIFSGRMEYVREKTLQWLFKQGILLEYVLEYGTLMLRPNGDYRPDDEVKQEFLDRMLLEDRERLVAVFDDRQKVVDMWRRNGITCFQVAPGNF